ncbi:hypothetical protein K456DRAFT_1094305 [Colletotrichum gloeosporioides 23]|nr:hypothetical protein K456DRAFT_1094305 [Colletotrichum gloeosporioides 23]
MNSKSVFFIIPFLCPAHSQISFLIMKNAVSDDDMLIVVYSPFALNSNASQYQSRKTPNRHLSPFRSAPFSLIVDTARYIHTPQRLCCYVVFFCFCIHPK